MKIIHQGDCYFQSMVLLVFARYFLWKADKIKEIRFSDFLNYRNNYMKVICLDVSPTINECENHIKFLLHELVETFIGTRESRRSLALLDSHTMTLRLGPPN